ncbi:winged helix-turn-helix domain-containing protein [Halobellus rubicundus]|uniref:Winged helix-turn-helix domain-containing protein n=1 Tax=Halobellus rubicundus TaxID=2996466 RepID=A0ABD5MA51_9EURY
MTLDPDQLNPTDREILSYLTKGRCTAAYISQETGYSKGNIRNRLMRLVEHGYVRQLGGGLYELIEDPRDGSAP